jgi:hypothetical protein
LGFSQGHHREFEWKAACLIDTAFDEFGQLAEVPIAGCQFAPGVADADNGAPVKLVVGVALIFEPATVYETVTTIFAKPGLTAAKRMLGIVHEYAASCVTEVLLLRLTVGILTMRSDHGK